MLARKGESNELYNKRRALAAEAEVARLTRELAERNKAFEETMARCMQERNRLLEKSDAAIQRGVFIIRGLCSRYKLARASTYESFRIAEQAEQENEELRAALKRASWRHIDGELHWGSKLTDDHTEEMCRDLCPANRAALGEHD